MDSVDYSGKKNKRDWKFSEEPDLMRIKKTNPLVT
jgi:hypothetical protein